MLQVKERGQKARTPEREERANHPKEERAKDPREKMEREREREREEEREEPRWSSSRTGTKESSSLRARRTHL